MGRFLIGGQYVCASAHSTLLMVIPILFVLASVTAIGIKFFKKPGGDESVGSGKYVVELSLLSIGVYFALIGSQLLSEAEARQSDMRAFEERLRTVVAPSAVSVTKDPPPPYVIDSQVRVLQSLRNEPGLRALRARFHPGPRPGALARDDRVIGNYFSAFGFPVAHLIGYPSQAMAGQDPQLAHWRRQMMKYLFGFLTDATWGPLENYRHGVQIMYLPWARSYDTWAVMSNTHNGCGMVFYEGDWGRQGKRPVQRFSLESSDRALAGGLGDDHGRMIGSGIAFLRKQLQLPVYERDPCSIFCTHNPDDGLRPMSLIDLKKKTSEWVAKWQIDSIGGGETPAPLKELMQVLTTMDNKRTEDR